MTVNRVANEPPPVAPPPSERPPAPRSRPAEATSTGTAMSRASLVRDAVRKPTKARLFMPGPTGSGKTWSSLGIATRIIGDTGGTGTIVLIDTEVSDPAQSASELYADHFRFRVIPWGPPYNPSDLALTIRELAATGSLGPDDVLIVDSLSHFWTGDGGTLDIASGKWTGWKVATPVQEDLVSAIIGAPCHVITCARAKMEHAQQVGSDGKVEVVRLGMAPVQRGDLEYEFQVVATLGLDHRIDIAKTRCAELAGRSFAANHQGEFADVYVNWLNRGVPLATMAELDRIRRAVGSVLDPARRVELKRQFKAQFGDPDHLLAEIIPAVDTWLAEHGLPEAPTPPDENLAGAAAELEAAAKANALAAAETAAARLAEAEARLIAADEALAKAKAAADAERDPVEADAAQGAVDGAEAELERAGDELEAVEAKATVEQLRDRIAAIEGKARAQEPPDEETTATEDDEARWGAIWEELTAKRLVDLSAQAQELGLPAGGTKTVLAQRVGEELYRRGYDPRVPRRGLTCG